MYFGLLDAQPTFTYNEEPLLERKGIDQAAIRVQKTGKGLYIIRDLDRYPGVEATLRFQPGVVPNFQVEVRDVASQPYSPLRKTQSCQKTTRCPGMRQAGVP